MKRKKKRPKYRAFNFDLKIKLLRQYYPKKNFLYAYKEIKNFMINNGFSHRQWSGYRSNEKLTDRQIRNLMLQMRVELPWIDKCSARIDVTNIEKIYDIKKFYAIHDAAAGQKDMDRIFKDSEVEISAEQNGRQKTLDERIKQSEIDIMRNQEHKSISKHKENYNR